MRVAGGLRDHLRGLQLMCRSASAGVWLLLAITWMCLLPSAARATEYPDQGLAYAACAAASSAFPSKHPGGFVIDNCGLNQEWREYTCRGQVGAQIFGCGERYNHSFSFPMDKYCDARNDYNGSFPGGQYKPRSGSLSCDLGCETYWFDNPDGSVNGSASGKTCTGENYDSDEECNAASPGSYYNRQIGVCEQQKPECPAGPANSLGKCEPEPCPSGMNLQQDGTCKKSENECPAGQIRSPDGKCLPGEGQCAAGEVRGPDGTCKKDSDGDGKPDEPSDEDAFSGGDDCNSPPSCSGSPIMCGQARIQWRIECNTRKNRNIAGGTCASMPVCTGEKCDAMEYSALLMQWRSACALEKMAQGSGNGGGENGDVKAIRDALTGTDGAVTTAPDRPASDVWSPKSGTVIKPDTSGYGWGGTCPQPPSVEVMGQTIAFDTTPVCRWLGLGSYFVMGLAALASLRIMATKDS